MVDGLDLPKKEEGILGLNMIASALPKPLRYPLSGFLADFTDFGFFLFESQYILDADG